MFKSFIYITLSAVLVFSILAPSVINLCLETDAIVLFDTTDEKTEKVEKNLEDKILNFYSQLNLASAIFNNEANFQRYLDFNTDYTLSVLLPPPEFTI